MKQAQMSEWEGCSGRVCIAGVPLVTGLDKTSAGYKPLKISRAMHGFFQDFGYSGKEQEDKREASNMAW